MMPTNVWSSEPMYSIPLRAREGEASTGKVHTDRRNVHNATFCWASVHTSICKGVRPSQGPKGLIKRVEFVIRAANEHVRKRLHAH